MSVVLYLVVPCFNEEEVIIDSCKKLEEKMHSLIRDNIITSNSRVVLVNDGSKDKTKSIMHMLHQDNDLFSCIHFSRNFGHQNAVMAGYMFSKDKCDVAISIDADLQQDINAIDSFIEKYKEGYDVVYGVRNSRDTDGFFKKSTSQIFYRLMQMFDCEIIPNHADYRLLSNKVLKNLQDFKESSIFLRGLIPTLGFDSCIVYFDVYERSAGKSKYSMKKMINLAVDGITSHSIKPLHIVFYLGWIVLLISLANFIHTIVAFFSEQSVAELTNIVTLLWFLGGLQLISIGCVGVYVGKNYLESKNRPRYIIESYEHNSERDI